MANKPSFKPNKNLGEGQPFKSELEYRKKLLAVTKECFKEVERIIDQNDNEEKMLNLIEPVFLKAISDSHIIMDKELDNLYFEGAKIANSRLVDAGSETAIVTGEPDRLVDLKNRQKNSIRTWYYWMWGRVSERILGKKYEAYYD